MTGERFRSAFFAVFPALGAKLEQKVNFSLHAYAVHGIYVYSGIRVAAGVDFAWPGPASKNPNPSEAAHALPLFTAPATQHRRWPFSCRACSCSQRSATQDPYSFCCHCARSEAIHGPAAARSPISQRLVPRCRDPQKQNTPQPVMRALRGCVSWKRGLLRFANKKTERTAFWEARFVIPAKAGIQRDATRRRKACAWRE
jgi:hypothetical protein